MTDPAALWGIPLEIEHQGQRVRVRLKLWTESGTLWLVEDAPPSHCPDCPRARPRGFMRTAEQVWVVQ